MSPRKSRSDIVSSETDSASIVRRGLQTDITSVYLLSEGTSSENKQVDDSVLEGSRAPSPQNGWGLLQKFVSGEIQIDWKNLWMILRAILFIAYVVLIGILFYRDNELGRLEKLDGFINFGWKASALFLLFLIVFVIISLLTLSNKDKKENQSKSQSNSC